MISLYQHFIILVGLMLGLTDSYAQNSRSPQTIDYDDLAREVFNYGTTGDIIETSEKISKLCPVGTCQVIGLGRSPTPIIELLNLTANGHGLTLPLSKFRFNPNDSSYKKLSPEQELKLFQYFDEILQIKDSTKSVLLIDYASSGKSLVSAQAYLERFLNYKNSTLHLDALAITSDLGASETKFRAKQYGVNPPHFIILPDQSQLLQSMRRQEFDGFSQYEKYQFISEEGHISSSGPQLNKGHGRRAFQAYFSVALKKYKLEMPKQCQKVAADVYQYH